MSADEMCTLALVAFPTPAHTFWVRPSTRLLGLLVGMVGLGACGGQTGEGEEGFNECADLPARPLADGESNPLGFSPAEVMEFAGEQRFGLNRGGDAAPLATSLIVRARPNSLQFIPTQQMRDVGMPETCRGRIELAVEVELVVSQPAGDLQLSASGRLKVDSRYRAELTAQFGQPLFDALRTTDLSSEERLSHVELRALLTPLGSAGTLIAQIARPWGVQRPVGAHSGAAPDGEFVYARSASIAQWPAESGCADGDLPLAPTDSLFGLTPEQVVQQFTAPRIVRWSDGSTTKLTLEVDEIPTACLFDLDEAWFEPILWLPILPENPADFGIPLEIAVATQDGRFASRISTVLRYRPHKTGGLERVWITHLAALAPGDAGGWSNELADLGATRSTHLVLAWPADLSIDDRLDLLGPPGGPDCDAAPRACSGEPGHPVVRGPSPILRSGTIE